MKTNPYTAAFYQNYLEESRGSARGLLPHVVGMFAPSSVVDVGCGVGTWLSVFRELGISSTMGIDGAYVDTSQLLIPRDMFRSHDLSKALRLDERFDIAVSLEVAEHIPSENAQTFVDTLTGLAPLVLFSAAIPFQGGDNHVNEQWPEYWIARFAQRNYAAYDCIRPLVWDNPSVAYYYAQNAFYMSIVSACGTTRHFIIDTRSRIIVACASAPVDRGERSAPAASSAGASALPHSLSKAVGLRIRRSLGIPKQRFT